MNIDDLLVHSDFVRSLACSLVKDQHRAADIEQQTWLMALENPPATNKPAISWLAKVIRNITINFYNKEKIYSKHLKAASNGSSLTDTNKIVEKEEIRRNLIETVLRLKEPYRTAIVLRYYDGLKPREISKQLDMPVERVRSHLKRGLNQLRQKLDAQHDGSRTKWLMALTPIAGLKVGTWETSAAVSSTYSVYTGGLVMSMKIIVILVILGSPIALWRYVLNDMSESNSRNQVSSFEPVDDHLSNGEDSVALTNQGIPTSVVTVVNRPDKMMIAPSGLFISGKVTDKVTGEPIQAFYFRLFKGVSRRLRETVISELVKNQNGVFRFPIKNSGAYSLSVKTSNHQEYHEKKIDISQSTGIDNLHIQLDPGMTISGRVLEMDSGKPVKGAIVGTLDDDNLHMILYGIPEGVVHAYTDEKGCFILKGLRHRLQYISAYISALHDDFVQGTVKCQPGENDIEIHLEREGNHLFGQAIDDKGKPQAGILINMRGLINTRKWKRQLSRPVLTNKDGSYRTAPVEPGIWDITASQPDIKINRAFTFTGERKRAYVVDKDIKVNFGDKTEYAIWRGILFDLEGNPMPGGRFLLGKRPKKLGSTTIPKWLFQEELWSGVGGVQGVGGSPGIAGPSVQCDSDGRFEIRKIPPGFYNMLAVYLPDEKLSKWQIPISIVRKDLFNKDIHMGKVNASISGNVTNSVTKLPVRSGSIMAYRVPFHLRSSWAKIEDNGSFQLKKLNAGTYDLVIIAEKGIRHAPGIVVSESQSLDNLKFITSPPGFLQIDLGDLTEMRDSINLKLHNLTDNFQLLENQIPDHAIALESGKWRVELETEDQEKVSRTFEITENKTFTITVEKSDFKAD